MKNDKNLFGYAMQYYNEPVITEESSNDIIGKSIKSIIRKLKVLYIVTNDSEVKQQVISFTEELFKIIDSNVKENIFSITPPVLDYESCRRIMIKVNELYKQVLDKEGNHD